MFRPEIDFSIEYLKALISNQIPESFQLEYKRDMPDAGDKGAVALLRSVTAMANARGGVVIFGMEAKDGLPIKLVSLPKELHDGVLQRIDNLCRDGVQPRLRLTPRFVESEAGEGILIVYVPRSPYRPHRITSANHWHFYLRQAASVVQMDVNQLRAAFNETAGLSEKIRGFRKDRLLAIDEGNASLPLVSIPRTRIVLHILPICAFEEDAPKIDFTMQHNTAMRMQPVSGHSNYSRLNLDGRLTYILENKGRAVTDYVQIYRDGCLEVVYTLPLVPEMANRPIEAPYYPEEDEKKLISALATYMSSFQSLGIPAPAVLMMSVLGAKEPLFRFEAGARRRMSEPADRDSLVFPEVRIEDWKERPEKLLRSTFDLLWNSFGLPRCENYDANGDWAPPR